MLARKADPLPGGVLLRRCPLPAPSRLAADRLFLAWAGHQARTGGYDLVHAAGPNATRMDLATLHCCHQAWAEACPAPTLKGRLVQRLHVADERRLLKPSRVRRLIAVSGKVRREAVGLLGFPPERIACIPHGVDAVRFSPDPTGAARQRIRRDLKIPSDAFLVASVGLSPAKGTEILPEALAMLPERAWLLVLGEGSREGRGLMRRAEAQGVSGRVVLTGAVADPLDFYRAADALAAPSRYDAFGLTVLEAMAVGLPVAASAAMGVSEILSDGVDGLVLPSPPRTHDAVEALVRLMDDAPARVRMGEAARETALLRGWDRTAEETFRLYREMLETGG